MQSSSQTVRNGIRTIGLRKNNDLSEEGGRSKSFTYPLSVEWHVLWTPTARSKSSHFGQGGASSYEVSPFNSTITAVAKGHI